MPTMEPLISETPWHRLVADEDDWRSEDPQVLAYLLEQLLLIRRFEERILELFKAGCVHGPAHASIGQEGGAVGAMSTLTDVDKINATHRAHHQFLAKFLNHAAPSDYDPREDDWPEAMLWARRQIEDETGPSLVESLTYRYFRQHGPRKGSVFGLYRFRPLELTNRRRCMRVLFVTRSLDRTRIAQCGLTS